MNFLDRDTRSQNSSLTHYFDRLEFEFRPFDDKLLAMYSAAVLDHFRNPRNAGDLPEATAIVEVTNPVCGDILRLSACAENGRLTAVRFKAQGCVTALACASVLTELASGKTIRAVRTISAVQISEALQGLPQATFHGAQLAAEALELLLTKLA